MNDFKLKLQAILDRVKSLANIRKDIQAIEAKLPKIKIKGTLNSTETRKELNAKIKNVRPKVKVDADTTAAVKKIKRLGQQKTNPKVAPTVDNTQVISSLKDTQKETKTLFDRFINGMIGVNLVRMAVQKVISAIHEAISSAKELDKIKTDIQMVSRASDSEVNSMMSSYNSMAKDLSSTTKSVSEAANEFLRMGESVSNTNELIKSAQVLSKVGMIESSDAASYLISSMKGYKIAAEDSINIVDKLSVTDAEAAVSAGGLAEALSKCSNIARNSGVTMDRLIGYTATVGEVTQKSMSEVGNSFQSIFSRMNNIKLGIWEDENGESLSDTEKVLNKLGIKLRDTADTYRDFDDVLDDIGNRWKEFSQIDQNAISVAIAGTRQRENFIALMNNYSSALEYAGVAADSAGSALERYEAYQNSVEAKTNELTAAIESLSMHTLSEEMFSGIIEATTNLVEFIDKTNVLKGTLAGLATMGISKMFVSMTTGLISASRSVAQLTSVMAMFNMGKSADNLKNIGKACIGLNDNQLKLVLSTKGLTDAQRLQILTGMGVEEQERRQTLATLGFAGAEDKATASTISFKGALNSLKAAWNMNPVGISIGILTTAVTTATMAYSYFKQANEELLQSTKESADAYKESASSIEDYTKRYQELHDALLKAKGNEEETYNIKKQLIDLQTELNDKYGEEYGAINLVTDAYKDQTEVIKALNKEAAQTFLNENQKGIEKATSKMTEDAHYNLSYTGIVSESDEGKILREIAEKYREQGVSILEELDGSQFSIHLNADPQSAYETIHDFENDVRDKARELGNEHLFDDILEMSSSSLNDAKSTIDKYGDIYKQALTADIVSDDDKAKVYNEALEAVQAYNEAVLQSEDVYNDESVENARKSLQALRDEINNNEAWEKYGILMDDIFDQADTRILDFNETLKNDFGLQKLIDDLKGLSDLDLKSLDENIGDNTSFDKLKESADKYDISVEELIDDLVHLGVVQGELASNSSEPEEPKWDYSTTLENLTKAKDSMDVLDKSFAKLFDKDTYIGFEDLSSIHEAFKDLEGIEDYVKQIQNAGQDTEKVSEIFGDLTSAYLEHTGILSNVTKENAGLITSMLTEMGVANAEEIVLAQLGQTTETFALQKQFLTEKGYELIDATLEEIVQFLNESNASDEARESIAQLALAKFDANNTKIDTSADIDNVIALANAAGASATAIANFKRAMTTIENAKTKPVTGVGGLKQLDYSTMIKDSVENSTYDWEFKRLNANDFKVNSAKYKPKYTGGSSTNKAIEQAKKDAEKASKESEKQFKETIDFFERRIEVLSNAFENLEKGMENVFGADAKNTLLSAQIGIVNEEINNYTDALAMYRQKADEALSGVSSDLRDKIKDGAVQITDFVGDGNEEVVDAMNAYEGWADKVADCTQKLEELKTQIRQLELQKFNNIIEDFTNQFDIHGDAVDLIKKQIGLLEEAGQLIGESFYTKQIEQSEKQLNVLEAEKKRLLEQLNEALTSGRVQKGTDEWLEMVNALSDVEGSILDCKTAIEEFDNELLNLNWQIFERVQTEFENISSELGNLAGLFDDFNDIRVSDGKGTWTDQAIATLGLYAQQYELAKYQVGQYSEAIDKLNKDYASGRYSATEYADKLADLVKGQWDAVNSAEQLESSIIDLNKIRVDEEIKVIEDEIDAYKKLTDAQIEALESARSLHEYELSIAEKTKAVADIQRQLAAMQNDNTAATTAKRKKLEEQLAEAKKALSEEEYQHSIDQQKDALNKNFEAFEEERNKEIEALKLTLEDKELLISNSLETVKANAALVGEQIAMIAQEHGVIVSDAVISSWKSGENAIASYGEVLSAGTSAFIGNIMDVQNYVYGLQTQANSTADSLAWMFSTRADNLVNELTSSYYSEANLNAMTGTLQNSLINTLERGYNINSITSALSSIASGADSVANAANRAAQALANMGAVQSASGQHGFKVYDSVTGKLKDVIYSDNQNYADLLAKYNNTARGIRVQRFAKGGIVSKDKKSPLDDIAKAVGEEKLIAVKSNEGVLTEDQLKALDKFSEQLKAERKALENARYIPVNQADGILSDEDMKQIKNLRNALARIDKDMFNPNFDANSHMIRPGVQSTLIPEYVRNDRMNINLHYDKMFEFNGDFNNSEQLLNQMQRVAKGTTTKMLDEINRDFKYRR